MQGYQDFDALRVSQKSGILRVALSDAPANAVSPKAHAQLSMLFRRAAVDEKTRLLVLTGDGEFAFSLGGNLESMDSMIGDPERWIASMLEAREIVASILECDKPVIGRLNGHAIGLGATMALCCDITCMVENAKIGDPHVKVGLAAGDGGAILWPALVGMMRAKRALLTGDSLSGTEAAQIGLITEAIPREQLDERVDWWIGHLSALPQLALRLTKRALNLELRTKVQQTMDALLGAQTLSYLGADHRNTVQSELARASKRNETALKNGDAD